MAADARSAEIERLERAFWQSLVDRDADAATALLAPEALMVGSRGAPDNYIPSAWISPGLP